RLVEGRTLDARLFLRKYELPVEGQRSRIHAWRQEVLEGRTPCASEIERVITLRVIDDLWADYLADIAEFRTGLPWIEWGLAGVPGLSLDRRDAHYEYAEHIRRAFSELERMLPEEIARRVAAFEADPGTDPRERGAVWTYLMTDQ